jgi:hypothetical protein
LGNKSNRVAKTSTINKSSWTWKSATRGQHWLRTVPPNHCYSPGELMMLDRDESALHAVQLSIEGRALLDTTNLILADIRDAETILQLFERTQTGKPDKQADLLSRWRATTKRQIARTDPTRTRQPSVTNALVRSPILELGARRILWLLSKRMLEFLYQGTAVWWVRRFCVVLRKTASPMC